MQEKQEKQLQSRLRSPVFWAALVTQVLSILVFTGVIDTGLSGAIEDVVGTFCQLFVAFGVFNDPTNKGGV